MCNTNERGSRQPILQLDQGLDCSTVTNTSVKQESLPPWGQVKPVCMHPFLPFDTSLCKAEGLLKKAILVLEYSCFKPSDCFSLFLG